MAEKDEAREERQESLEGGTYEIIRRRLQDHGAALRDRLNALNKDRREVFGSIEPKLLSTERITTDNNCTPRDIVALGETFIFAYNVQFGLKSTTELSDVFSIYRLDDENRFEELSLDLIRNDEFEAGFANLYKYYKHTIFKRFYVKGPHLYMVFRVGRSVSDVKTFKWLIKPDNTLEYVDNRSDHEYRFPPQHEFEWKRTNRDHFREGRHPHVSIEDRVFIECVGGDLTIKIEDNTESGEGLYAEEVEHKEQKLDDAEILYAIVGPLILMKVKPYREDNYRYYVFNEKLEEVRRIDEVGEACVLLPDDQGLIFSNGYYLVSGEYKKFDYDGREMLFERRISSPNGEDTLFVFYNREESLYVLLPWNMIDQSSRTPILCHGFSFFHQGELLYFRSEDQPQRHHTVQIWQTPFVSPDYVAPVEQESYLYKIGNKDLVRAMAECQNIINLVMREDSYKSLYDDIYKECVGLLDSFFWIRREETHNLGEVLKKIRDSASAAIDEFEKVRRIRKNTRERIDAARKQTDDLLRSIKPDTMSRTDEYIGALAKLRRLRGEIIGLRELRYTDEKEIAAMEERVVAQSEELSGACIEFLLKPDALAPYEERVDSVTERAESLEKAVDAKELEQEITDISHELETMIEIVGNLKIEDPTKSTQIIDGCSAVFTRLNTARAALRNRKKELSSKEAVAEFSAQVKLLDQSVVSFLDVADTPEKCDEYLNKLLVQIEELEARFADFDEYVVELAEKRGEISTALEARKLALVEETNKRAAGLQTAADRILKAVRGRVDAFREVQEINSYFAGDLMIEKVRGIIEKLVELNDPTKADEIQTRLKTIREDAVRQLKDRKELFVEGKNVIRFGRHAFSVTTQKPDLTILNHDGRMCFHITGTNFYEPVQSEEFLQTRDVWNMEAASENQDVYRGEFLAWQIFQRAGQDDLPSHEDLRLTPEDDLIEPIRRFMGPRYDEGYSKGVHDLDAARIVRVLAELHAEAGLLRFASRSRALARVFWNAALGEETRARFEAVLAGIGQIRRAYANAGEFHETRAELLRALLEFVERTELYEEALCEDAAEYLFEELTAGSGRFVISPEAAHLHDEFLRHVREAKLLEPWQASLDKLEGDASARLRLVRGWIEGFVRRTGTDVDAKAAEEAAAILFTNGFNRADVHGASVSRTVEGLRGSHPRIAEGKLALDYPAFTRRLRDFERDVLPRYRHYHELKKELSDEFREDVRLNEFQPRVLTSFVRNQLINDVYLPIVGDNLAKQIGTADANKRTDLMGMLLLVSPPGYGKTTLMEYIASRLGVIFMKVNGPAIGHRVTSLDPADAPNAAAREEVEKLNLAFEMGDNVMIYLDDIQHLNAEFLQKFISLCDGQRKVEGVWKGRSRTYDLRGRKVCVVMAGNPYTESGEKFQIPDMLANRADTYNLGDIIGDNSGSFELSFIENSLTSNSILSPLNTKSRKDIYAMVQLARGGSKDAVEFEGSYGAEEINDYVSVLQKLFRIQEVILKVNKQYIASAAQQDAYRTEPAFKLQGSYRNMNKLAEKVLPVMNDAELKTLICSHYEQESQTLTSGAEANLLKFYELTGWMTDEQRARWEDIKKTFQRNQRMHGMDAKDTMTRAVVQLGDLSENVASLREGFAQTFDTTGKLIAEGFQKLADASQQGNGNGAEEKAPPPPPQINIPEIRIPEMKMPEIRMPESLKAELSDTALAGLKEALSELRLRVVAPNLRDAMEAPEEGEPGPRGEFLSTGAMRTCFEENGFAVEEMGKNWFRIQRDNNPPIDLKVRNDRLDLRMVVLESVQPDPALSERLLELNGEIVPVSFAVERTGTNGGRRLVLLETRDGRDLTRLELIEVIRALETAAGRANEVLGDNGS